MTEPTKDTHQQLFFLTGALQQRVKVERNNFSRLADKINAAYHADLKRRGETPDHKVDRRKLKAIVEGKSFSLSVWEFEAFDLYLDPFGMGLSHKPILRRTSILETLAEKQHVVFLIGTKPHEEGHDLSLWDMTAMAKIQRYINNLDRSVRSDIEPIALPKTKSATNAIKKLRERYLFHEDGPSLVILGSPRANLGAEVAIQLMMSPLVPPRSASRLPFHFAWSQNSNFRSYAAIEPAKIRRKRPDLAEAVEKKQQWALQIGDEYHVADARGANPMKTYGVLLAQRRKRGQVWMVLSGLSGPATLGCAEIAHHINQPLTGQPSPVLWAPVCTSSSRPKGGGVDQLDRFELVHPPKHWPSLEE